MSETTTPASTGASTAAGPGLRRELRFWEAIALSIAIMAPTAAMALNGAAPAGLIGRAVPLAFIFATLGVLLVSYAFIRLSRYFSHAGSVFAFSGVTLGPRAGFFSGLGAARDLLALHVRVDGGGGNVRRRLPRRARVSGKSADYIVIALFAAVSSQFSPSATSASPPGRCWAWRGSRCR